MAIKILQQLENDIIKEYNAIENISLAKVAKKFKVDPATVRRVLIRNNYRVRTINEIKTKYTFDINFFDNIDCESKAYWLGFIYADGVVTGKVFQIKIHNKDINLLEKFKQDIKSTHPIHTYFTNQGYSNNTTYCTILFTNEVFVNKLIMKGVLKQKSLILKFPTNDQVPNHLIHHFMRGYFDGDGSIYCSKNSPICNVVGTIEFLTEYRKLLPIESNAKIYKEKRTEKNTWYIVLGGSHIVKNIFDFLYKDAYVYLDRKYERFKNYLLT